MSNTTALTPVPAGAGLADSRGHISAQAIADDVEAVKELMRAALTENIDYGRIPNTPKPTLFKPGAEQLLKFFRLGHRLTRVETERDADGRPYGVTYRCDIYPLGQDDLTIASGEGYCGFDEPDKEAHQTARGKAVPRASWNTVMQMAQKRAFVSTTLRATGTSGLFTQDIEEIQRDDHNPNAWFIANGWEEKAEHDRHRELIVEALRQTSPANQAAFRQWRTDQGIEMNVAWPRDLAQVVDDELEALDIAEVIDGVLRPIEPTPTAPVDTTATTDDEPVGHPITHDADGQPLPTTQPEPSTPGIDEPPGQGLTGTIDPNLCRWCNNPLTTKADKASGLHKGDCAQAVKDLEKADAAAEAE